MMLESFLTLITVITAVLFFVGVLFLLAGVYLLVFRSASSEVQTLAVQATQLAQKSVSVEMAGMVGQASAMFDAVNQMTRTTRGTGIFLAFFGLVLVAAASWLILQIVNIEAKSLCLNLLSLFV